MHRERIGLTNPAAIAKAGEIMQAIGIKGAFARAASRELKLTPEYEQARAEGRARAWLESEASSFAEAAYELLQQRKEDLDA